MRAVQEIVFLMALELKGFTTERIGDLEIPDLFLDLNKVYVFECHKDSDDEGTDKEAEGNFFLQGHSCSALRLRPEFKILDATGLLT